MLKRREQWSKGLTKEVLVRAINLELGAIPSPARTTLFHQAGETGVALR